MRSSCPLARKESITSADFADDPRPAPRDDLTTVPVEGIEPCQVVVVARNGDRNPPVSHFVRSAKNLLLRDA